MSTSEPRIQPIKPRPLEFYALGQLKNPPPFINTFQSNRGFRSTSSDLLQRNIFSVNSRDYETKRTNYKQISTITNQNIPENNYLTPLNCYKTFQKFNLPSHLTNKETYNIAKEKIFATDKTSSLFDGKCINTSDYLEQKKSSLTIDTSPSNSSFAKTMNDRMFMKSNKLNDKVLVFDKNEKQMLRNKGFWIPRQIAPNKTKISKDAPEWFDIVPEWKIKELNDKLAKTEETINVFSRYQGWITVKPGSKDRRHPLEKIKTAKKEETSQIMPQWMKSKYSFSSRKPEDLKSVEYYPSKTKAKKMMVWVDKELNVKHGKGSISNDKRSIFNIGDFRHNVPTKENAQYYGSKVSQLPKVFFEWDDGKRYNAKTKKDI